jgi:hypothetical protein
MLRGVKASPRKQRNETKRKENLLTIYIRLVEAGAKPGRACLSIKASREEKAILKRRDDLHKPREGFVKSIEAAWGGFEDD